MALEIPFASRDQANAARDEFEDHLAEIDDSRKKAVAVVEDAEAAVREMQFQAADGLADVETGYNPAEVELTAAEEQRLDFAETSYVEAKAAKAAAIEEGVSDFAAYFDPTLSLDENREVFREGARDSVGRRLDEEPSEIQRMAGHYRSAQSGREEHAIKGVRQGSGEARQALRQMGWSPQEINEIVATGQVEAALTPGSTVRLSTGHKITPREWARAKRSHEHRRVNAQNADEGRAAPVTSDVEKWREHPDQYDYPGVDTRRPIDEFVQEQELDEFRTLTNRLWTWQPGTGRGL